MRLTIRAILTARQPQRQSRLATAFSFAELLVVVGVVCLLIAVLLPALQLTHRKAQQTRCSAQLQQLGRALESSFTEFGFYPLWDDGGAGVRYTWIDVLIQRDMLGGDFNTDPTKEFARSGLESIGYCPADRRPDPLNASRHNDLIYPLTGERGGVDYSYGISVPLSAGGWAWRPSSDEGDSPRRPRLFRDHDRYTSTRVLAGDAHASHIYNLSGDALKYGVWNTPTQFDNTVAWGRHASSTPGQASANLLYQDGHVSSASYAYASAMPLNTMQTFVWYPGESLYLNPADRHENNWYPCRPPPSQGGARMGFAFPTELDPRWYTEHHRWTGIRHK